jgi:hypothetical protein
LLGLEPIGFSAPLVKVRGVCLSQIRHGAFGQYPVVVGDFVMSKDRHVTGEELLQSSDVIFSCGFQ